jgi:hypothetical protein
MKTQPYHNPRPQQSTRSLLVSLALSSAILAAIIALTSCGGTFTLRPDGTIGYTTPEILKAPIVYEK